MGWLIGAGALALVAVGFWYFRSRASAQGVHRITAEGATVEARRADWERQWTERKDILLREQQEANLRFQARVQAGFSPDTDGEARTLARLLEIKTDELRNWEHARGQWLAAGRPV